MTVEEIAERVNDLARGRALGELHRIRSEISGRSTRSLWRIFSRNTIFPEKRFAFHDGGRHECQFNIGYEDGDTGDIFRYGIAFSFEPSRFHNDFTSLYPKLLNFNYLIRTNPQMTAGLLMWHWANGIRSENYSPRPVDDDTMKGLDFVFVGECVPAESVDIGEIVLTLERLLPVYQFVERGDYNDDGMDGRPPSERKPSTRWATSGKRQGGVFDIGLRHNELQCALEDALRRETDDDLAFEVVVPRGRVDAVLRNLSGATYFEIKVAPTARLAVREAVGQLLEYSCWPGAPRPERLVVIGEGEADATFSEYMQTLRNIAGIELYYRRLDVQTRVLGPNV